MSTIRITVPPIGDISSSKYAFIVEAPGKIEIRTGRLFSGAAGQELMAILHQLGISKNDCYFTSVIKDILNPKNPLISFNKKGTIISTEGQDYLDFLWNEIRSFNGVIVALGGLSLFALTDRWGISKWRGSILKTKLNQLVIPSYNPDIIVPPKNQWLNKTLLMYDIKKAEEIVSHGYHPTEREYKIAPTYHESLQALERMRVNGLSDKYVSFDIEIHNMELSCISFSLDPNYAISIPFIGDHGDYYTIDQEAQLMLKIAEILENPRIKKLGQNLVFDTHFLLTKYGIHTKNCHDTMIAQQILMSEFPKGLDFITSIYTDLPYYKDEGKKFFKVGGHFKTLWEYNDRDSIVCAEAFPKQLRDLGKQGNLETYERQRKLIEPLVYMMEHGIRVDVEGMTKHSIKLSEEIVELQKELNDVAGKELNTGSAKQLKDYFYVEKNYAKYVSRSTGNITTDNLAMKRLKRKGSAEAGLILKIRSLKKLVSTYMPLTEEGKLRKVDDDGRIRCFYNPVGTRYSRISSSKSIFGTGMNMMNWPKPTKVFFLADEGYIYYSFDLAQAENRIVAYVANEEKMIEAFETGKDVHRLTAALIFQKELEEVSNEENSCVLGDGSHSERFWGKKANHGLNYDLGYSSFALLYEIPVNDGKFIVERYHKAYPGVRQNFHTYIRKCLSETRTITNLMGRRTLFLDKWEDSMFKEAYSCIPQGTVGDVINERSLEPLYYESDFTATEILEQVHDSIGFQLPIPLTTNKITWQDHANILLKIKNRLETPLVFKNREFIIPADLSIGFNMYNTKELKGDKLSKDPITLTNELIKIHKELVELHNGKASKGLD